MCIWDNLGVGMEAEKKRIRKVLTEEIVKNSLRSNNIIINDDLIVDIYDDVWLHKHIGRSIKSFGIQFGEIRGDFYCVDSDLRDLDGCPKIVHGSFNCTYNGLKSLVGGPNAVGGDYICMHNELTSLDGLAEAYDKYGRYVYRSLSVGCNKISSLKGLTNGWSELNFDHNSIINIEELVGYSANINGYDQWEMFLYLQGSSVYNLHKAADIKLDKDMCSKLMIYADNPSKFLSRETWEGIKLHCMARRYCMKGVDIYLNWV